jgi:hypothetical protein
LTGDNAAMKLLHQDSDTFWKEEADGSRTRHHRLSYAEAIGDFNPTIVFALNGRANAVEFAGVGSGHLFAVKVNCDRNNERWTIDVELQQSTQSRLEPPKIIDGKTGEVVQLLKPMYSAVDFRDHLPAVKAFPERD